MKKIFLLLILLLVVSCTTEEKMTKAKFKTNLGTFEIKLYTDKMPITTKNFIDLANKGFYDGTKFHRVIDNFMIQGGDPLSKDNNKRRLWGTGGPGYKIKDEFDKSLSNKPGTIAMANAGPNTGGSQFFINTKNNNYLDTKHPVFGEVINGMDIIKKISKSPTNSNDQPLDDIIIEKVTIN